MKRNIARLTELIEPAVKAFGLDLWGVEHLAQGRFSLLRIYIDGEAGVDIKDCERVSRQVSAVFDVEAPIAGEYTLEVSSPGLDRPLFNIGQFARFIGFDAALTTRAPMEGRRRFKGTITQADETANKVRLAVEDGEYEFAHGDIEKANIVHRHE